MRLETAKKIRSKKLRIAILLFLGSMIAFIGCMTTDKAGGRFYSQEEEKPSRSGIPRQQRSVLAVLKFMNTTSHEQADYYKPWEYGIAAMLTTDIEQTAMFNIVDRVRLYDIINEQKLQESGLFDQSTAISIGKLVTAEYLLTGTFMVVGNDLKIMAQVFSVEEGIQLGAISVVGKPEQFFILEKDLFIKISKTLSIVLDEGKRNKIMASIETKSVDASLKNYSGEISLIKAEEMKKLGNRKETKIYSEDARQKFRDALEADPQYKRAKENLSKLVMAIPMTL